MASQLWVYTNPVNCIVTLKVDNGVTVIGIPAPHANRNDAQLLDIPFETDGIGCSLRVSYEGYTSFDGRAILITDDNAAWLNMDDFRLQPIPATNPTPPPDTGYHGSPEEIIHQVADKTHPDLSTHDGCGKFTEDCAKALHENNNQWWGHIKKNPGQNQYNGHAVDAIMLATGEGSGIYDIIHDSVSPNASPAYNYKGPADLELWYYPADGQVVLSAQLHFKRIDPDDPDTFGSKHKSKR